jgi:hypothetical protein
MNGQMNALTGCGRHPDALPPMFIKRLLDERPRVRGFRFGTAAANAQHRREFLGNQAYRNPELDQTSTDGTSGE